MRYLFLNRVIIFPLFNDSSRVAAYRRLSFGHSVICRPFRRHRPRRDVAIATSLNHAHHHAIHSFAIRGLIRGRSPLLTSILPVTASEMRQRFLIFLKKANLLLFFSISMSICAYLWIKEVSAMTSCSEIGE